MLKLNSEITSKDLENLGFKFNESDETFKLVLGVDFEISITISLDDLILYTTFVKKSIEDNKVLYNEPTTKKELKRYFPQLLSIVEEVNEQEHNIVLSMIELSNLVELNPEYGDYLNNVWNYIVDLEQKVNEYNWENSIKIKDIPEFKKFVTTLSEEMIDIIRKEKENGVT